MLFSLFEQDDLIKYSACLKIENTIQLNISDRLNHFQEISKLVGSKSIISTVIFYFYLKYF